MTFKNERDVDVWLSSPDKSLKLLRSLLVGNALDRQSADVVTEWLLIHGELGTSDKARLHVELSKRWGSELSSVLGRIWLRRTA